MHPIICTIGPFTLYSYGAMIALGSLVFLFGVIKEGSEKGIQSAIFYDLYFWVLLSGLVGARILYILTNLRYFLSMPGEMFMIQHGGLSWFGGFCFGLLAVILVLKKNKLSFLKIADILVPYLALAQAVGRIGCLLNGCCYGRLSILPFAIALSGHEQRLHPTQLYSAFGLLIIFAILMLFKKKKTVIPGGVFSLYLVLYGLKRFIIEFFRADTIPTVFFNLSLFQIFALIEILCGVLLYIVLNRTSHLPHPT